jgi:hypothetical protein|tara:strand:+ start:966 stop:1544 length:579 start_codon:yes stop_codon:yes gene_type:complete
MADLILPRGERKVLQAEDKDYKRGLLVKLLKDGGYSMAYWFNKPDKPYPVEVLVDGKSIKKDAKVVEMKFHPKDYYDKVQEAKTWSKKYKRSIDCNNPKGFSQKAHCAGRKKRNEEIKMNIKELVKTAVKEVVAEDKLNMFLEKNVPTDKSKWSYYKSQAKKKFDVYPSAYANAWAAKQYKAAGGGWRKTKG